MTTMVKRISDIHALDAFYDLAIIGAGPAGLSAAAEACAASANVVLFDENPAAGGQIYRGIEHNTTARRPFLGTDYWRGKEVLKAFVASKATYMPKALVWSVEPQDGDDNGVDLRVSVSGKSGIVSARRVIFATGAMERPMPVRGWTLPGVMTVGAAQIALKASGLLPNGRVVLAGTGPLLYMFGAQLLQAGGEVAALLDTTPGANYVKAAPNVPSFLFSPYAFKGLSLLLKVHKSVPVYSGVTDIAIEGKNEAETICFSAKGKTHRLAVDSVFLHQGVIPNNNLANASGCALIWNDGQKCFQPQLDGNGRSSVPAIYIAGDGSGIGGALVAEQSGRIAALAACQDIFPALATTLAPKIVKLQAQARRVERGRAFIDALYLPAQAFRAPLNRDTIVCRCEEVTTGAIRDAAACGIAGPNQLKTMLRCGMGPCQGRMCSSTVTEILAEVQNRAPQTVGFYRLRAPVKPVPLGEIAALPHTPNAVFAVTGEQTENSPTI
ncbi:thioredoxin reductase/bacterioferritin-associated ferredoxin [Ochrobactrum sp. RC6B]|uniref:FAD/NAD(P)-dependent oxidoreductase n=1 Tax=Brucella intermedia TaxID=94625 RepID=UPI000DD71D3D|nr:MULTISPECIES: NAD(P)/FAD-dependent oxidoreductase [Brucella/Ochrobactrum group]KAB2670123.1 NAD(P)-binding protein [Ochrobactrum sp. LMG 5442]MBB3217392.1 thioredoxin reductase/bacterioferritin-associated ferredoxin [Ochrobactrum sp. RC6B]